MSSEAGGPPDQRDRRVERGERSYFGWIILVLVLGFALLPRLFSAAKVDGAAADFTLAQVANARGAAASPLKLSELRGNVVLLDFWATWCGPCRAEAPILDKLASRYKDRGLVVVGVNTSDEEGNAAPWVEQHGIHYPIVFDSGEAASSYGVTGLPTMVLVSRDGKVLSKRTGLTSDGELERLIEKSL